MQLTFQHKTTDQASLCCCLGRVPGPSLLEPHCWHDPAGGAPGRQPEEGPLNGTALVLPMQSRGQSEYYQAAKANRCTACGEQGHYLRWGLLGGCRPLCW